MSTRNTAINLFYRGLLLSLACVANSGWAACPQPDFSGVGTATYYSPEGETNSCGLPLNSSLVTALPVALWDGSAHCGECLQVTGPLGSVLVQVIDKCPDCPDTGLDPSESAFAAIANLVDGVAEISWQRVECPVTGPVQYRFVNSSAFFLEIQAQNIRHGVFSMAYQDGEDFVDMPRQDFNRFRGTPVGGINDVTIRATANTGDVMDARLGDPTQTNWIEGPRQFQTCINDVFEDGYEALPVE